LSQQSTAPILGYSAGSAGAADGPPPDQREPAAVQARRIFHLSIQLSRQMLLAESPKLPGAGQD
jgi:hypothetical protein